MLICQQDITEESQRMDPHNNHGAIETQSSRKIPSIHKPMDHHHRAPGSGSPTRNPGQTQAQRREMCSALAGRERYRCRNAQPLLVGLHIVAVQVACSLHRVQSSSGFRRGICIYRTCQGSHQYYLYKSECRRWCIQNRGSPALK